MKHIVLLLVLGSILSCSNDFDVIEETRDVPIVYGLLNQADTAQYIRVERAFVEANTSALILAQDPERLYYPETATVAIKRLSTGDVFPLTRVDGNMEGFVREEGVFAQSPNFLYKILTQDIPLVIGEMYEFQLNREGADSLVTATTEIVEGFRLISPSSTNSAAALSFLQREETFIRWSSEIFEVNNRIAEIYDVVLDFHFRERDMSAGGSGVFERKELSLTIANNINETDFELDGSVFYTFLKDNLVENPSIDRRFDFVDINIIGGNESLKEFLRIGEANVGLTSSQDFPPFTNLSEGRGLFGSINRSSLDGLPITGETKDSLANGIITRALNFDI